MTRISKSVGCWAAAATIAVALAACGSSDDSSDTGGTGKTIDIALVSDFTGPLAPATGVDGALAYFKKVNDDGGVDGYKVNVKQYDAGSAPATALQAFRKAVADKPAAILEAASGEETSSLSVVAHSGIPVVDDGFSPGWIGQPTLFSPVGDVSTHQSDAWLRVLQKQAGATRVAVLSTPLLKGAIDVVASTGPAAGVDIVLKDASLPQTMSSARNLELAHQIKSTGADGVLIFGTAPLNQLQADLKQVGADATLLNPGFEPVGDLGSSVDGLIFAEDWATPYVKDNKGIADYLATMKQYGYDPYGGKGFPPFRYAQAKMLVEEGLKPAGAPFDNDAVVKALGSIKGWTADGILSGVSFPEFQHEGISCLSVMQVVDGEWTSVTNGEHPFICGGKSLPVPGA